SALAALGIGVIVLFRGRKFTWIIGLVTFAVGLLEHMAWNYWGSYDFLGLLGAGRIPLAIFYLAWIAAGIHCIIVRAWGKHRDPLFPAPRLPFAGSIRHWPRQLDYTRLLCRRTAAGCVTVFSVRSSLPAWRLLKGSRLQQWTPRCS